MIYNKDLIEYHKNAILQALGNSTETVEDICGIADYLSLEEFNDEYAEQLDRIQSKVEKMNLIIKDHLESLVKHIQGNDSKLDDLEENLNAKIIIRTPDDTARYYIGEELHNQLVGNEDYANCNIVLNCTDKDSLNVGLWIDKKCKHIPRIIVPEIEYNK